MNDVTIEKRVVALFLQRKLGQTVVTSFPMESINGSDFIGASLWIDSQNGCGMVILANRLMSGGPSAPNLNPFRLATHRTILKTGELDHEIESDSHGTAQPTNGAY